MQERVELPNPARPIISENYEVLLKKAGLPTAKEALKHEADWNGYADKMENRNR